MIFLIGKERIDCGQELIIIADSYRVLTWCWVMIDLIALDIVSYLIIKVT